MTSNMKPVVVYSSTICPYCMQAKMLLKKKGAAFTEIMIDRDTAARDDMIKRSGRRTVPQIWIGEQHVGGCDDLYALEKQGQLDVLLAGN